MKISQREARRLRARVGQLEDTMRRQTNAWVSQYPGVDIGSIDVPNWLFYSIHTAKKLGHAVVVSTAQGDPKVKFFVVKE